MKRRDALAGVAIGGLASAAIVGVGRVAHGWVPGPSGEYAISTAMMGLVGPASSIAGAAVLFLLLRFSRSAHAVSVLALPLPWAAVAFYEIGRYPSSHNLIPFELMIWLVGSALLHLPSFLVRVIRERWRASSDRP